MSKINDFMQALVYKVNRAVRIDPQALTEAQKKQVRDNIDAASVGDVGVRDYNELENKPFGIEHGVILPETSVLAEAEDGDVSIFVLNKSLDLVEGEAYTVTWNGVEYTCTAKWMMDDGGIGALCLGNTSVADNGGTGEPFLIATLNKAITDALGIGETTICIVLDGVGGTLVQLSIRGSIIKHIDNKYLDPFFEIASDKEILPEETLAFSFADFTFEHMYSERLPLIAGRKYTVILDGVEYVCECKSYAVQDNIMLWLGDFHKLLYSPDIPKTDEPFCVFTSSYGEPITAFVIENPTDYGDKYTYTEEHTFAIFENDCRELFLKPKHLPMDYIAEKVMEELPEMGGGVNFTTDASLKLDPQTGVLSVNTAKRVEEDNTLPITSAAVYTVVGNIEALLKTI